ncbi:MAG TPA: twin-arginine translocase TatA/TatE family subunit [Anaerolineae bacterium]|nr:twin-arginine translocase TatA/TatE family subunit [Anaerolineae bacterium]
MNIFSNIGITELIVILLLALLVVGPERLPEMGRKLAKTLKDVRKMYENLTSDLGPELMSIQRTTQELRESVESVRSIPQDALKSVMDAAELEDTIADLKEVTGSLEQVGQTISSAGKIVKDPVGTAVDTAREALLPSSSAGSAESTEPAGADTPVQSAKDKGQAGQQEFPQEKKMDQSGSEEQPNEGYLLAQHQAVAIPLAPAETVAETATQPPVAERGSGETEEAEQADE